MLTFLNTLRVPVILYLLPKFKIFNKKENSLLNFKTESLLHPVKLPSLSYFKFFYFNKQYLKSAESLLPLYLFILFVRYIFFKSKV